MTLFEVEELMRYWADNPPVHLLAVNWLGVRRARSRRPSVPAKASARVEFVNLLAELGPGFAAGDVHGELPAATVDFDELRERARTGAEAGARRR